MAKLQGRRDVLRALDRVRTKIMQTNINPQLMWVITTVVPARLAEASAHGKAEEESQSGRFGRRKVGATLLCLTVRRSKPT